MENYNFHKHPIHHGYVHLDNIGGCNQIQMEACFSQEYDFNHSLSSDIDLFEDQGETVTLLDKQKLPENLDLILLKTSDALLLHNRIIASARGFKAVISMKFDTETLAQAFTENGCDWTRATFYNAEGNAVTSQECLDTDLFVLDVDRVQLRHDFSVWEKQCNQ